MNNDRQTEIALIQRLRDEKMLREEMAKRASESTRFQFRDAYEQCDFESRVNEVSA